MSSYPLGLENGEFPAFSMAFHRSSDRASSQEMIGKCSLDVAESSVSIPDDLNGVECFKSAAENGKYSPPAGSMAEEMPLPSEMMAPIFFSL